jgi:hypothetical protein
LKVDCMQGRGLCAMVAIVSSSIWLICLAKVDNYWAKQ